MLELIGALGMLASIAVKLIFVQMGYVDEDIAERDMRDY